MLALAAAACGSSVVPSPDPDVIAGAGFLRCDDVGHPVLAAAWARLDVHSGNRPLDLRVTGARYVIDGGSTPADVYDAYVSQPVISLPADTDTALYLDVTFRDRAPAIAHTYAIELDVVESDARTWHVRSPAQAPACKSD
ncbi:hypothetical protein BH09MYX1_BH09MYX1_47210 [soil metagenome]